VIVLVIMLAAVAWRVLGSSRRPTVAQPSTDAAVPVDVVTVQMRGLTDSVTAGGTVEALEEVTLTTKLTGRVAAVPVKEGDRVRAGQVLVRLEDDEILVQVRQAEAAVAQAQANLENAIPNLARMESLYDSGAVSKAQLDAARLQLSTAKAQVAQAEAALGFAQLQAHHAVVVSPLTGTVTHRYVDPGSLASLMPGQSNLVTVAQIDTVYVVLDVSETDLGRLRVGQQVAISADAYPQRKFLGSVREIAPSADSRTRNFRIKVAVENPDHALKPGMFARGDITVAQIGDALVIPRDAVVSASGRRTVFVVEAGKARIREVRLGQLSGPVVQILSGLRVGESVVVAGLDQLADGTAVTVR
jgi:RND family efflux transporter MFP subunit